MRFRVCGALILVLSLVSCSKQAYDASQFQSNRDGQISASLAGYQTYQFAFSGQVLDAVTGDALKNFAVELAGTDAAVSAVINPLGERNGLFHISRNPKESNPAFTSVPVVISAAGFESKVFTLDLGGDCGEIKCPGVRPTEFLLKPLAGVKVGLNVVEAISPTTADFAPVKAQATIKEKGMPAVFRELAQAGKFDRPIQNILASSNNRDVLTNVMVMFNGRSSANAGEVVGSLVTALKKDRLKNLDDSLAGSVASVSALLVNKSPEMASSLLASSLVLPYLIPVAESFKAPETGKLGQVMTVFLADKNLSANLTTLVAAMKGESTGQKAQLAMGTLLPLAQSLIDRNVGNGSAIPYATFLASALDNPALATEFSEMGDTAAEKNPNLTILLTYLQPLVQALAGKEAAELGAMFNQIVTGSGAIMRIKNFPRSAEEASNFARITPYLESVVRGLNSKDGEELAELLIPILAKRNPAVALRGLITNTSSSQMGTIAATLFPSIPAVVNNYVPGKQIFAAQLVQGLVNGDFGNLQVTQDLKGAPAVIVSGYARDLLKLAQLPNVERIVAVGTKKN